MTLRIRQIRDGADRSERVPGGRAAVPSVVSHPLVEFGDSPRSALRDPMLRPLLVLLGLLALACAGPKKDESDDPGTGGTDSNANPNGDTNGDTDVVFEGDDPGECSDGADNDRDGDFDCDDADCASSSDCAPPGPRAITGTVDGELRHHDPVLLVGCEGTLSLDWDVETGAANGTADCVDPDYGNTISGDIVGTFSGSTYDGIWSIEFFDLALDVPVSGRISGDHFTGTFDFDESWGYVMGDFDGYAD